MPPSGTDQSGSEVGGHQVAHDYNEVNVTINEASRAATVLERLLARLNAEVENKMHCHDIVAKLRRYHGGTAADGVVGLVAKLERSGRQNETVDALEQKEMFSKLMEEWSLYSSAQDIFVYLLARTEHRFKTEIFPEIHALTPTAVNRRVNELIVEPTVDECGATVLKIDHLTAMGMVYWLAEQCFVRWH